jgi:hypothetical protein
MAGMNLKHMEKEENNMLGISREEAELMRTFSFSLKMKNHVKIVTHFKDKFEQDPANIDSAFNYGMCMSLYVILDPIDSDKLKHLVAVNEAFARCLEHNSEWWIARYLRSEVNEWVPDGALQETDAVRFPAYKQVEPAEDRSILIEQQKSCPQTFSYFLCPYMAQTRAYICKGKLDEALQSYKDGLAVVPIEKSPFNFSYLNRPFYEAIVYFRKLDMTDAADEIKKVALTLFPDSRNLCMA